MSLIARLSIVTILFPLLLFSQTPQEASKIIQNYDKVKLQQMQKSFLEEYEKDKAYAFAYAKARGIETIIEYPGESYAELQRVLSDGTLIYYKTHNVNAATSTRTNHLNTGGSTGFNLDGQNMVAYVWDGGHARVTHQEYDGSGGSNRVTVADAVAEGGLNLNFHAAHVVGTIGAAGILNAGVAKGMATHSQIFSYKWNQDLSEATTAATNGMLVSNHSYGYGSSGVPDYFFGAYIENSRDWDNLHYNAPYYLMVVAAGNDGSTNHNALPLNPSLPQFDKLTGHSVSKNNMVVANAQDANVDINGNLISVAINSSSSQGPTDDLRIKPDITGNGTTLISTLETSDTALGALTGTSMASPNVAGTLLLLQQHHNNLYSFFMRSSTLKGLALHTADDAGIVGPDTNYGWGLLNAKKAAETISQKGTTAIIEEIQLFQGQSYTTTVNSDGVNNLLASISWTDPAGTATTATNSNIARLVNDLDVRITKNTSTFFPWRLTGVNTNANNADNSKDNFERIGVSNASGSYTITVTHKGVLSAGSQVFSLIVTGVSVVPVLCQKPQNLAVNNVAVTTANLSWNPSSTVDVGYEWVVMSFGEAPNTVNAVATGTVASGVNSVQVTGLPESTFDAYVRTNCGPDGLSSWSLPSSFSIGYCDAGAVSSLYEKIANVTFNAINNSSTSTAGYENFTTLSTTVTTGEVYTNAFTASISSPYSTDQIVVWIDFNQDGDFLESNERVFISPLGGGPHTGSIQIPANAALGNTIMRVRLHDTAAGANNTPCGNSTYGQVEDYTIVVQAAIVAQDRDGDGVADASDLDSDNDGILNSNELIGGITEVDTDNDGIPNHLDLDSDNDGIPDNVEAQSTVGYLPPANDSPATYLANNGINSVYVANPIIPVDSDGDGIPDFRDTDSDNDGLTDLAESFNPVPTGIVGINGMIAGAESADNYTDVNGLAYNGTSFTLRDTDNDVPNGANYDYRDIPQTQTYLGTQIISSFSNANLVPNKTDAYLNIISNNLGVVITRVNGVAAIINPVEGMIVYDISDNTFKVNTTGTNAGWRAFGN